MDGVGEPAGDIQGALDYDLAEYERLLREGIRRDGRPIESAWGSEHTPKALTEEEIHSVIAYTTELARAREDQGRQ